MLATVLGLVVFMVAGTIQASVQVNKVSDFGSSFKKLAILPAAGPAGFDTIWLDDVLSQKLASRKVRFVHPTIVRQAMFDLGITELTPEQRKALAEKLGVDAFIAAAVDAVGTQNAGAVGVLIGGIFTAIPSDKNTGSVQLVIISADNGKLLMRGIGHGESELRSKRGVVGSTFDRILDQVFTPEFFAARKTAQ